MKIYHIIENIDDNYGGPARSIPNLITSLKIYDFKNYILSVKYNNSESNELIKKNKIQWKSFNYKFFKIFHYSLELRNYLEKKISKDKNSIIHIHNNWNYIPYISYKLSKKYNVPLILSLRGSIKINNFKKKIVWFLYQKKILNHCKSIIVTNKNEINFLRKVGVKSTIHYVPNGIDISYFNTSLTKKHSKKMNNLNINKKYILYLSRIHKEKGLDFLVNSWIKLASKNADWDLLIVGPIYDQQYFEKILDNINKNDLKKRFHFKGSINGKGRIHIFNASDLFVLPSFHENFGISIAEAMAVKLPVLTTNKTPWHDIKSKNAGWWIKLSQKNLDITLKKAISDHDDLKKKGINAYKLIKNYDLKLHAKKLKNIYDNSFNNTFKSNS